MKNWSIFKKVGFFACYGVALTGIVGMFLIDKNATKSVLSDIIPKISTLKDSICSYIKRAKQYLR